MGDPDRQFYDEQPEPPGWAVFVARVIAVVVVVPTRLAWEWIKAAGRLCQRVLVRPVRRVILAVWRGLAVPLWRKVLAPAGRGVEWVFRLAGRGLSRLARGTGWVLAKGIGWPLTWLWRTVVRPAGRLLHRVWARVRRFVLGPLGKGLARVFRVIGRGLYWLAFAVFWVLEWGLVRPLGWLLRTARRLIGRGLTWLAGLVRRFMVVPVAKVLRRFVAALRLFWSACRWAADRVAMPLWRLLVRLVTPVGRAVRWVWRGIVVRPGRWVRDSVIAPVRLAGRRLRRQLGGAFRR